LAVVADRAGIFAHIRVSSLSHLGGKHACSLSVKGGSLCCVCLVVCVDLTLVVLGLPVAIPSLVFVVLSRPSNDLVDLVRNHISHLLLLLIYLDLDLSPELLLLQSVQV